jgi:two-component system copper resistance phosphate regulon response regulator CusR
MRILVIESDSRLARTIALALKSSNFAVDIEGAAREALQLAMEIDYDGIILESNLAPLDGLTVLRRLRKAGASSRILMLGAISTVTECVAALRAGADDYLMKPFASEELLARMVALLRRPREVSDKITIGDLELDRKRHTVVRGGKSIKLTQREYSVLECLMRNAGRTVTRAMLIAHVWNLAFEGDTNIVDVYIKYLRQKVDTGFHKRLIQTARGLGYSIPTPQE